MMTLADWAAEWPYKVRIIEGKGASTPDSVHDEAYRAKAFWLTDYVVSSVSGGSIWFLPALWVVKLTCNGRTIVDAMLPTEREAVSLAYDWHVGNPQSYITNYRRTIEIAIVPAEVTV